MRKILSLLLVLLIINIVLIIGFVGVKVLNITGKTSEFLTQEKTLKYGEMIDEKGNVISIETGVFRANALALLYDSEQFDAIPDAKTALKVATAILESGSRSLEYYYVPETIRYDSKDEIWIVSFREPSKMVMGLGGSQNLAIRKRDGKVLSTLLWY